MASSTPEITLQPLRVTRNHLKPSFAHINPSLRFGYSPSRDGVDSNLLILLHGLGDTHQPFFQLGQSLNLPQTAVLALQAPERVPLLEEEAWQWWDSFDQLGELIQNPNPSATLHLLTKLIEYLTAPLPSSDSPSSSSSSSAKSPPAGSGCGWLPSQIHLFGFQQGGSLAGEFALSWARSRPSSPHLGSIVAVTAPLLSHPTTLSSKAQTKVALVYRKTTLEETMVGAASWKKGFENVKEIRLEGGRGREGMPRGMEEWREIMRFWMDVDTLFRNATSLFLDASKRGTHPDLYAGVDLSSMNVAERWWVDWYTWWGNPILATGAMSFVLHELLYFGRALPFIAMDQIPFFKQWKIQANKMPSAKQQWECTKGVLLTHFSVELPQIYLFFPMAASVGMKTYHVPFPSVATIAWQVALFFLVEDTWHFWVHRAAHWGPLYKHVHKVHHTYSAPFGLAAEYAHPLEVLFLGAGTVLAPLAYCWASGGNMHIVTTDEGKSSMYIWIALRLFQAIDSHSGYDFPWGLRKWFPLWAGADHHDYHHEKFVECYASSFRHWDWLFGTDKKYHAHREKQAREKRERREREERRKRA
ncbi:hypothetical protein JCM8547_007426 [Rhodosporidiobolus lusitaniae]